MSHDAARTGAPIILLNLIQWLVKNADMECTVLLRDGGELEREFAAVCPTYLIGGKSPRHWLLSMSRSARQTDASIQSVSPDGLERLVGREIRPHVVYSNTVTNGDVLARIKTLRLPVITHVHELDFWMRHRVGPEQFQLVDQHTDLYITVAEAVSENLIARWNVAPERIRMVYGFILPQPPVDPRETLRIRRELGIPDDAFVVGGAGTLDWRKAPEHIVQLMLYLNQRSGRAVHAVWLGGVQDSLRCAGLQHDVAHAGLSGKVHFIGAKPNPLDYFSVFDVFAMVSREDPFPLVNMEAASLGIPTVCFSGSGGSSEFVSDGCGVQVAYLDINEMANQIVRLIAEPELRRLFGDRAKQRVQVRHSLPTQARRISAIISEIAMPRAGGEHA